MSLINSEFLNLDEQVILNRLPNETSVFADGILVRMGSKSLYDQPNCCPAAWRMREDFDTEISDYLMTRLHRIKLEREGWTTVAGKKKCFKFCRRNFNYGFEDDEKLLLCSSIELTEGVKWWIIKDLYDTSMYVKAQCIVRDDGYYIVHAKNDIAPHPSGLSRSVRAMNSMRDILFTYRKERKGVES